MVLATKEKKDLIDQFKLHESDTGSPEVQVELLTKRISYLTEHLKKSIINAIEKSSIEE